MTTFTLGVEMPPGATLSGDISVLIAVVVLVVARVLAMAAIAVVLEPMLDTVTSYVTGLVPVEMGVSVMDDALTPSWAASALMSACCCVALRLVVPLMVTLLFTCRSAMLYVGGVPPEDVMLELFRLFRLLMRFVSVVLLTDVAGDAVTVV